MKKINSKKPPQKGTSARSSNQSNKSNAKLHGRSHDEFQKSKSEKVGFSTDKQTALTKNSSKNNLKSASRLNKSSEIKSTKEKVVDSNNIYDDKFWLDFLSDKKSVENLREQFNAELERQKLEAIAEFAAGAGHEINNPLAIISGHAQLLLREIDNAEHQRKLSIIIAQVKRAYEMIADVRYFARPPEPVISKFDLVEEIHKIVEEQKTKLQELNQEINIEIIFETKIKSLKVETDRVQLHIALSALCNNSRESLLSKNIENQTGQRVDNYISIRLRNVADKVEISVEDNGVGILPEIRQLIFCPYFSGRQAGRGLGFGLPKTWRIVQQLKGTIKTETKKHITKFIVTIPKNS
ncbi:MAG: HAMP domain-containing histidine kinase [Planctomycetaceae bacterium]|jgi:signal transduction histidine kinase|nr:HAMP domain-containing histidine kinase [Planctomycetaceae bacterium]